MFSDPQQIKRKARKCPECSADSVSIVGRVRLSTPKWTTKEPVQEMMRCSGAKRHRWIHVLTE